MSSTPIYCELSDYSRLSALGSLAQIRSWNTDPADDRIAVHLLDKLRKSTYLTEREATWLKRNLIFHQLSPIAELKGIEVETRPRGWYRNRARRQERLAEKQARVHAQLRAEVGRPAIEEPQPVKQDEDVDPDMPDFSVLKRPKKPTQPPLRPWGNAHAKPETYIGRMADHPPVDGFII